MPLNKEGLRIVKESFPDARRCNGSLEYAKQFIDYASEIIAKIERAHRNPNTSGKRYKAA
jgi:hypothetical protein